MRSLRPSPALSPEDVVAAQLAALQRAGPGPRHARGAVAAVWELASPGNRASTGPLDRFASMLHGPAYRCLLGFRTAQCAPLECDEDTARQDVVLVAADGAVVGVTFVLSRQVDPPYAGCWMTDGVRRHPG